MARAKHVAEMFDLAGAETGATKTSKSESHTNCAMWKNTTSTTRQWLPKAEKPTDIMIGIAGFRAITS